MSKHNKKRNIGIMYELLLRHMSNALIESNKKDLNYATKLIESRFKKTSEVYKEFRIFSALSKANIESENHALSLINECKNNVKNINIEKLNHEKSNLIHDINYNIASKDKNFYYRDLKNYKNLANIQLALNEWKKGHESNMKKTVELEQKILKLLLNNKTTTSLNEVNESIKNSNSNKLVYNIMLEKINEKYSNMSSNQKSILSAYAFKTKSSKGLSETLSKNKDICLDKIKLFEKTNTNDYLKNKISEVKKKILKLDPNNLNDKSIVQFLTVTKLIDELS